LKALVLKEYKKFVFEEVELPRLNPEEVLIKVKACAVCGSDVHGMDGSTGRRIPPIIMGHEASGVVTGTASPDLRVATGSEVVKEGDRVTFDSTIYCGNCEYCKNGHVNLCDNRRVIGVSCTEYRKNGAFAEYIAVPSRIVYKLPDEVTFEQAAMIEPLSVAYHAVEQARGAKGTALVVGCGNIGLLIAQILATRGVEKIVLTDVAEEKLELAKNLGFESRVDSGRGNVPETVREMTDGKGADLSFDAVGTEASVADAVRSLRKRGTCVLVGNITPSVPIPLQEIVTKQLSLVGSCASAGEYSQCLGLLASGKVDVNALISRSVPLADGSEWINKLYAKTPGLSKIILIP